MGSFFFYKKTGLYFSIQPDKIRKSEIFATFEKIHRSFLNNQGKKFRLKRTACISLILISTTTNLLHAYYFNIATYETLEKIKILL